MIATFHNHSTWSDGRTSFEEIYAYAKDNAVDILGLSDHLCVYPDGRDVDWTLAPEDVPRYIKDVLSFSGSSSMEIRVGIEYDWFEGHGEVIRDLVESTELDYRIGAVHHVEQEQFDMSFEYWTSKSPEERTEVWIKYWRLIEEMAESGLFDLAAHLDLPKKLGFYPEGDIGDVVDTALEAVKANGMAIELNTAGFGKKCADGYPSVEILEKCRNLEIPATLSSDGHKPEHILYEYERGLEHLKRAGYREIVRFREREIWFESLDDALTGKQV